MPKYQLLIRGENFFIQTEGKKEKPGFYTTRWVEANSPTEGEASAIELIKQDSSLKGVILNPESDPPVLYVEEIMKLKVSQGLNLQAVATAFLQREKNNKNN